MRGGAHKKDVRGQDQEKDVRGGAQEKGLRKTMCEECSGEGCEHRS